VKDWEQGVQQRIAGAWLKEGVDAADGRLTAKRLWMEQVSDLWAVQARKRLPYREWKISLTAGAGGSSCGTTTAAAAAAGDNRSDDPTSATSTNGATTTARNSLGETIDKTVPAAYYAKVLQCLRDADASGMWPTTTPKRQLVIVSTPASDGTDKNVEKKQPMSLAMTHVKAKFQKSNFNKEERSSAYAFEEG